MKGQKLDQLAHSMVCDDRGILQQFFEFVVGPLVSESIAQVKVERVNEEIGGFSPIPSPWSRKANHVTQRVHADICLGSSMCDGGETMLGREA